MATRRDGHNRALREVQKGRTIGEASPQTAILAALARAKSTREDRVSSTPGFLAKGSDEEKPVAPPAPDEEESRFVGHCMICDKEIFGGWYGGHEGGARGTCGKRCEDEQNSRPKVYPKDP